MQLEDDLIRRVEGDEGGSTRVKTDLIDRVAFGGIFRRTEDYKTP